MPKMLERVRVYKVRPDNLRTLKFKTIPKVLIASVHRFSFANWVPKKVDIDLTGLSAKEAINLEAFIGKGVQPGETELPEMQDEMEEEPTFDAQMLADVIQMGIPEHHAKHALLNTNQTSAELAVGWYFENLENPKLNEPIPKIKKKKDEGSHASE